MTLRREIVPKEIEDAVKALADDEELERSHLAQTLLASAYQAAQPGDSRAAAVRRALRDCWTIRADRIGHSIAGREKLGRSERAGLKAMLWTGVRYGLAPGREPMDRETYSAWVLDSTGVAEFLRGVLRHPKSAGELEDIGTWAELLGEHHLNRIRRQLLETMDIEVCRYLNASGLRSFRDSLADPRLDEDAWQRAVTNLQVYLTQEYETPTGKWVPEVARDLLRVVSTEARRSDPLSDLELLVKQPPVFYQVPPGPTADSWFKGVSSELAGIWNGCERALEESCRALNEGSRDKADAWRRRGQNALRVAFAVIVLAMAAIGYSQWRRINVWLDRPDVARAIEEIAAVAKRYPHLPFITDAFAWGETMRRLWPMVLGYVLLTLTLPWAGMWIERRHRRRVDRLREWKEDPEAYVQRAIREGQVRLADVLAAAQEGGRLPEQTDG